MVVNEYILSVTKGGSKRPLLSELLKYSTSSLLARYLIMVDMGHCTVLVLKQNNYILEHDLQVRFDF